MVLRLSNHLHLRDIGKLAKTSLVSMIFVVFIIGTVFYRLHDFEDIM